MSTELIPAELLDPAFRLSEREQKFCDLIADGAGYAEAAIGAGYSPSHAAKYSRELRNKKKIQNEILRQVAEREGYAKVDDLRVLKELMTIVNADIGDYIDEDGFVFSPEVLKNLPPHKTKAIQSIKQTVDKGKVVTEVKMYDKLSAIDKVARHVGFYRDEQEQNRVININLPGGLINIS